MKIVKFGAVLNVISLVTSAGLSSQGNGSKDDLSEESKTVYDNLPNINVKNKFLSAYMKAKEADKLKNENSRLKKAADEDKAKICKLESKLGYGQFLCAADRLITQTEIIYPQYVKNPYMNFMSDIEEEVIMPVDLQLKMGRFRNSEVKTNMKEKFRARNEMANFFYHMYALLTGFNTPNYKECLESETYCNYAESIIRQIFKPSFSTEDKNRAIEDFCSRYAHIRHCFSIFTYYHTRNGIQKTADKIKQQETHKIKTADATNSPILLCDVLEEMNTTRLWRFTKEDLDVMNIISSAILQHDDQFYFSHECNIVVQKEAVQVLIPLTDSDNCIVLKKFTTTSSNNTFASEGPLSNKNP